MIVYSIRYGKSDVAPEMSHGLAAYVEVHGWKFTDELAAWASRRLFGDGTLGIESAPSPDELFLANMAMSDFYPSILRDKNACLKYAKAVVEDKDGYDGMPFKRWLTDCEGRGTSINWDLFI